MKGDFNDFVCKNICIPDESIYIYVACSVYTSNIFNIQFDAEDGILTMW